MKADVTRFSHQPQRGYAGVLAQQGRVTLDADWNEQLAIDDHHRRALTADTIGAACAPADAAGFRLSFTPDGRDLIISPGRMYVAGMLVELLDQTAVVATLTDDATVAVDDLAPDGQPFAVGQWVELDSNDGAGGRAHTIARVGALDEAAGQLTLEADLGAHTGHTDVLVRRLTTYLTQPHYPADDPEFGDTFTPQDWDGQTHLAYLDVWRRHVTALEDPHLREVALGGPDTTTRVQTAWAVRLLREEDGGPVDAAGLDCADDHPAWDTLAARSGGRMSARAEAAPDPQDPCAIAPEAGYRGVENRLYRVEIHEPGERGTATFKWSRDNGTVLASIVDFEQPDELRVHSLGRDAVLRFAAGDRVEVFGEASELAGAPGTMASIVGAPDEAARAFTVDADVSRHDGDRLPRVRRWDHAGAEPVTTDAWVELEHGVQVRFGGGPFHVGDHWVVPARTATGDVEGFVDASALGIVHHHARLALLTWPVQGGPGAVEDCRSIFPSLCDLDAACCTVTVGEDGDHRDLQAAVDAAADIDGPVRICLLPGEHVVPATVVVNRGDLTIAGCGQQSRVLSMLGGVLLLMSGADTVRLEDLWLTSSGLWPAVGVLGVTRLEIVDCQIANVVTAAEPPPITPPGELPEPPPGGMFEPPRASDGRGPGVNGAGRDAGAAPRREQLRAADPYRMRDVADVRADPLTQRPAGPAIFASRSSGVTVDRCVLVGAPAVGFDGLLVSIEHGLLRGGVWLREGTARATVRDNTVVGGLGPGVLLGGMFPGEDPTSPLDGVSGVTVAGNLIEAMTREGISTQLQAQRLTGEVEDVEITGNTIRGCGWMPFSDLLAIGGGVLLLDTTDVRLVDNTIEGNGPTGNFPAQLELGFGVFALSCQALDVHGNRITDNGRLSAVTEETLITNVGVAALAAVGSGEGALASLVLRTPAVRVHDNTIVTPQGPGVLLHGVGPMSINDNSVASSYLGGGQLPFGRAVGVVNLGAAPDAPVFLLAAGGAGTVRALHGRVQLNDNQISVQADEHGLPAYVEGTHPFDQDIRPHQLITGSAVLAASLDDVEFSGNQVVNELPVVEDAVGMIQASVAAFALTVRITDNRITDLPLTTLLSYVGQAYAHIATDNITTRCIRVEGACVVNETNIELLCARGRCTPRQRVIIGK